MADMYLGRNDTTKYNQYNNALNAVNNAARGLQGESFNSLGAGSAVGGMERHKHKAKSDTHSYFTDYYGDMADTGANENSSYANLLNDYFNGTGYGPAKGIGLQSGGSWDDYAKNTANAYQKAMDTASNQLKDYGYQNYLKNYDYGTTDSGFGGLVDQRNESMFNDAKAQLDRDRSRGYLNNAGYQTALNALMDNTAYNRGLLTNEGMSQYDKWNTDMNQIRTQGFDSGLDSLSANANNYMKNYNVMTGGNMAGLGSYGTTLDSLNNYGQNISDDAFLAALTSNTYDPSTYVATGAEHQGVYNPFNRGQFNVGRRKRMTLNSIGEY